MGTGPLGRGDGEDRGSGPRPEPLGPRDRVLVRLDRAVTRKIAGETLVVPIRGAASEMHHVFAMNPVAAHVWEGIDGVTPVSGLVASVCEAFEVEPAQAEADVVAFLGELLESGLAREA